MNFKEINILNIHKMQFNLNQNLQNLNCKLIVEYTISLQLKIDYLNREICWFGFGPAIWTHPKLTVAVKINITND